MLIEIIARFRTAVVTSWDADRTLIIHEKVVMMFRVLPRRMCGPHSVA